MQCARSAAWPSLESEPAPVLISLRVPLLVLGLLAAIVVGVVAWREALIRTPPSVAPPSAAPTAFAGASPQRMFLSASDSAEAARRGLAPAGTRSMLSTGGKLGFGQWRWDEAGVPRGPLTVRVDLKRQLVSVFRGPDEIGTAVIVYGIEGKETPRGRLPILGKTRDHHSRTYDAPMPFSLWLRDDGVAIHGSSVRMGKATNGCIGVPVDFAGRLFEVAAKGDIVEVVG